VRLTTSGITLIAFFSVGAACASSGGSKDSRVASSSPDLITSVEIAKIQVNNAYEIISRLRPRWLQATPVGSLAGGGRSQIVAVYLDGNRVGAQEGLRSISATGIKSIRYYDAVRAATVLRTVGSEAIAGAISISTTGSQ
jgi:hypothetical protein